MSQSFHVIRPDSWETTRLLARQLARWSFRGHQDASWGLDTALHRTAVQVSFPTEWLHERQLWMLRQFQRRAHHYISDPPSLEQRLEWLALIQHYGGPTALLDFTHSFYVAAFFAVEQAVKDVAIWAVNLDALERGIRTKMNLGERAGSENIDRINTKLIDIADKYIRGELVEKAVIHVEPDRMNERLSIQQGLFLLQCDLTSSFQDNLSATLGIPADVWSSADELSLKREDLKLGLVRDAVILKIILPLRSHRVARNDLYSMNITAATLFPGLDGFARSLHYHLVSFPFGKDDEFFDRFEAAKSV